MKLQSLHLTDWRSIPNAELHFEQGVPALFYGENDAGKSNLLAGVEAFGQLFSALVATGVGAGGNLYWFEHQPGQAPSDDAFELAHPVRHGTTHATLTGTLLDTRGRQLTVQFVITNDLEPDDRSKRVVQVERVDGRLPKAPLRVVRIGEGRSWHEEFLSRAAGSDVDVLVEPNGLDTKLALFRYANHTRVDRRSRFESFQRLVSQSPFGIPAPTLALGDALDIQILIEDRPVEERGAGVQQWVLAAAMVAVSEPDVILFEEPETHLSWKAQQHLASLIQEFSRERVVLVASHSPHLSNIVGNEGKWYEVVRERAETIVTLRRGSDALWSSFQLSLEPEPDTTDPRKLTLFPGNLLRLHDKGVAHLGIKEGDAVVASLAEESTLRIESLENWTAHEDPSQ